METTEYAATVDVITAVAAVTPRFHKTNLGNEHLRGYNRSRELHPSHSSMQFCWRPPRSWRVICVNLSVSLTPPPTSNFLNIGDTIGNTSLATESAAWLAATDAAA